MVAATNGKSVRIENSPYARSLTTWPSRRAAETNFEADKLARRVEKHFFGIGITSTARPDGALVCALELTPVEISEWSPLTQAIGLLMDAHDARIAAQQCSAAAVRESASAPNWIGARFEQKVISWRG